MKKNLIILSLCMVAVLSLCACKSKKENGTTQASPAPTNSSAGSNYDGDYHANNSGSVSEEDRFEESVPPSNSGNSTTNPNSNEKDISGRSITDSVRDSVDDLVDNARNALRRDKK